MALTTPYHRSPREGNRNSESFEAQSDGLDSCDPHLVSHTTHLRISLGHLMYPDLLHLFKDLSKMRRRLDCLTVSE